MQDVNGVNQYVLTLLSQQVVGKDIPPETYLVPQ